MPSSRARIVQTNTRRLLQDATTALQGNVLHAATPDARHNALTLKTVFGLALFAGVVLPDLLDLRCHQVNPAPRLDRQPLPLLTFDYANGRLRVPLIKPLRRDFQQVLNPSLLPEASVFGWRECGRFVALHRDTLEHYSARLGLPAGWCDWLPFHLNVICPSLDWPGLRRRPPRLHQAWTDFNRTVGRLATDLGWTPAPLPSPEAQPPAPNLKLGQHGIFALACVPPRPGDALTTEMRW